MNPSLSKYNIISCLLETLLPPIYFSVSKTILTLEAGPFSISSQSTSWHLSVKSEHYEQSSQQMIEACHLTCQLGTLTEVRPLEFDNVKYARGHNQYLFTSYQLDQGREFMHTSCKALTSVLHARATRTFHNSTTFFIVGPELLIDCT